MQHLTRPENNDIQLAMFYDYQNNVPPVAESRQRAIENSHLCSAAPLRVTNKRIELIGAQPNCRMKLKLSP